jgi:hypothetical protein
MTATTGLSYGTAPNQVIRADNGIDYAYREIGTGTVPLVLLQHFRGNLENWDHRLVDALGAQRRVVDASQFVADVADFLYGNGSN